MTWSIRRVLTPLRRPSVPDARGPHAVDGHPVDDYPAARRTPPRGAGAVPDAVAFEAITAQLAHERGELSHDELVAAFSAIVSDVRTQGDAFELLARVVKVAGSSLAAASEAVGTDADSLLRTAALRFARESA